MKINDLNPFRLDAYILELFQKLSDWLQEVTTKTCFWFATLFIACSLCANSYLCIIDMKLSGLMLAFRLTVTIAFLFFNLYLIEKHKHSVGRSGGAVSMNPLRHILGPFRLFLLFDLILIAWNYAWRIDGYYLSSVLRNLFDIAFVYFMCLTPKPGSKNTAGKWLDALSHALFGKLVPQGA